MQVVVDASVIIDYTRRGSRKNSTYVSLIENKNSLVLSLVTISELFSGNSAFTKRGRKFLDKLISGANINIPRLDDAIKAGKLRQTYQLSLGDAFIAALAKKLNAPVATLDNKAFSRIKGLKIYKAS